MICKIDHLVITTENVEACIEFYKKLGFVVKQSEDRYELYAGDFKINVHIRGKELLPHAKNIQPGSVDLCFEIMGDLQLYREELESENVVVELGIVERNGVKGSMKCIYMRDPDGNLIEFCSYQ